MSNVFVQTPKCPVCHEVTVMVLTAAEAEALRSGALMQDALPERSAGDRELLISGTHDACWQGMWPEGD